VAFSQKNPATVPLELAQSLVLGPFETHVAPDIYVGELPPRMSSIPLPKGVRVIGSIDSRAMLTAAIVMSGDEMAVREAISSSLVRGGWRTYEEPADGIRGGFVSSDGPRGLAFCSPDSTFASFGLKAGPAAGQTRVLLYSMPTREYSACRRQPRPERRMSTFILPTLKPLPNSSTSPSGSGSSTGEAHSTAYVRSSVAPEAIAAHYSAQLIAAGWTATLKAKGDGIESDLFELKDKEGQSWNAVLITSRTTSTQWPFMVRIYANRPTENFGF